MTKDQRIHRLMQAKAAGNIPVLVESLQDPDVRTIAASFLGDLGAKEAIPEISRLLSSSNPRTRSGAIKSLRKLHAVEQAPALLALALNDESSVVRSHAVGALETAGGPKAQQVLIEALNDPEPAVGWCAARVLGLIGDEQAIGPLKEGSARAHFLRRGAYRKAIRAIRKRHGTLIGVRSTPEPGRGQPPRYDSLDGPDG
jgi:HEAT repeat protein